MTGLSDYGSVSLTVQLLTTVLIGFVAWMDWQTYEYRKVLMLLVLELEK